MAVADWLSKSSKASKFFSGVWSSVLAAAAVFVGGIFVTTGARQDPWNVFAIGSGSVLLIAGWATAHYGKRLEALAKEKATANLQRAKRQAVVTYNNKMSHIFSELDKVVDPATRQDHLEAFKTSVMVSSTSLFQVEDVRTCLYILDGHVTESDTDKPSVLVHVHPQYGRTDQPRKSFEQNTTHGRLLFNVMSERRPLCIPNTGATSEPIDSADKEYKSFIAVPITSGNDELGVLTVDAIEADGLDKDHVPTAVMLASLMAIGLQAPQSSTGPIIAARRRG